VRRVNDIFDCREELVQQVTGQLQAAEIVEA